MPKKQANERCALILLTLCGIKENDDWLMASKTELRIHDMMELIGLNYDKHYKENSRETFRKDTLDHFIEAAIVEKNQSVTNSPNTRYSITDETLEMVKSLSPNYKKNRDPISEFIKNHGKLEEKYRQKRDLKRVPVMINNKDYLLSSGKHNELQRDIVEEFAATFLCTPEVLYLGDTENKDLVKNGEKLDQLGIVITDHDKLPDVVIYDSTKDWVIFIEAVTSVGPMSCKRVGQIESMSMKCDKKKIYVTAFPDFKTFKKFADQLSWETEVWISEIPDHMIHLNGDKFLSAHSNK